jgi:hypothetical protein
MPSEKPRLAWSAILTPTPRPAYEGTAGKGDAEALALSAGASASCAGAHWGKPGGIRPVVGCESHDNPILGTRLATAVPDRAALS